MPSSSSTAKTRRRPEGAPSFVCELPLRVGWVLGRRLAAKLEAARQVYNACLGEALRRLGLVRQSVWFSKAAATAREQRQERQAHFRAGRARHGFSDAAVQRYGIRLRSKDGTGPKACKTWIGEHLGAHEAQALASRAYRGSNEHLLGKRGRPRFKGKGRLHALEGKGSGSGLRWRGDHVVWGDLALRAVIDADDPVVRHALCSRVKYARVLRRQVRGRSLWYVQLVCAGHPYRKPKDRMGRGSVGLDLGPSTLAAVSAKEAMLVPFCAEVEPPAKVIRRLQRHIAAEGCAAGAASAAGGLHLRRDRQRRAGNPGNYLGTGGCARVRSDGGSACGNGGWRAPWRRSTGGWRRRARRRTAAWLIRYSPWATCSRSRKYRTGPSSAASGARWAGGRRVCSWSD